MSEGHAPEVLRLHPDDNVLIAPAAIAAGTRPVPGLWVREDVPAGHKIAAKAIKAGEPILKYRTVVGFAASDIEPGTWLHDHNIVLDRLDKEFSVGIQIEPDLIPERDRATFQGYARADGRAGTRNYVAVLSSVNCSATVSHKVAEWFTAERLADFANVDGVVALTHTTGCGMEGSGEAIALLRRTLAGYARHPNVGAVLMIGLGCERNQIGALLELQGLQAGPLLRTLNMQDHGGTRKTIDAGIAAINEILPEINRWERTTLPASHIVLGLQCGASDGFSAISANPALGFAADLLVRNGGTAILSETPEIYGVEHLLAGRAINEEVAAKLMARIRWWEGYARGRDVQFNGVVTPGNRAGGISNIVEKSLGALMKAGTSPLTGVFEYAEAVTGPGLVFLDTPGYDPVAVTGQVAGGANVVCFTTGRGSAFGCKPVPSLKLASNTAMYRRLEDDMDINCGVILDGEKSVQQMGDEIFRRILATASGQKTKSELLDVGQHEFVPWQLGITG